MHGLAEKRDPDVGFDPSAELVPDGEHFDLALHRSESGFGFGQLHVGSPQLGGAVIAGPVRAQQIRAIALDGGLPLLAVPFPLAALFCFVVSRSKSLPLGRIRSFSGSCLATSSSVLVNLQVNLVQ